MLRGEAGADNNLAIRRNGIRITEREGVELRKIVRQKAKRHQAQLSSPEDGFAEWAVHGAADTHDARAIGRCVERGAELRETGLRREKTERNHAGGFAPLDGL